ncbi:GAF domain-containing protein, partial [Actinomadura logoneensis]
ADAAELAARMRAAATAQATTPRPERCQLGGAQGCAGPAEIKIADSWGDAAWGCPAHVEEALINVRSVFLATEEADGLAAYLNR